LTKDFCRDIFISTGGVLIDFLNSFLDIISCGKGEVDERLR
jgi:hypothetical protein